MLARLRRASWPLSKHWAGGDVHMDAVRCRGPQVAGLAQQR